MKKLTILLLLLCSPVRAMFLDTSYELVPRPELVLVPGVFLPHSVVGVRDSYPMVGLYYSNKAFTAPKYEIGLMSANAKQVTWYNFSLAYKIDVSMYDTLEAFISFGLDAHYYKRKPGTFTEYPFVLMGGAHIGFGTYHKLGEDLFLRADFKFNFGPGKTFFVGLGLVSRWDNTSDDEEEQVE